jgi:hypothetical protein
MKAQHILTWFHWLHILPYDELNAFQKAFMIEKALREL